MVIKVTDARDADQSSGSMDNEPDRKAVLREREISDGGKRRRRRDGVKEKDRESWQARWRTVEECMQYGVHIRTSSDLRLKCQTQTKRRQVSDQK